MDYNLIAGLGTCLFTGYLAFFAYTQNRDQRKHHQIQIEEQRKHHQQKSTIELLISNNNNAFYLEQRKAYVNMRSKGENFTALACKINEKNDEIENKNATITTVLNSIEFICVGIREGIFDEAVYKRMSKSSLIYDWNTLKPYIMELRRINNNNSKLFCEFEWLATKWIDEDKE